MEIRVRLGQRSRNHPSRAHNGGKKRTLSPEARKRIATAAKKRWAEYRKSTSNSN